MAADLKVPRSPGMQQRPLPRSFYARPAPAVAADLVGAHIASAGVLLRITETEAYCGPGDTSCHARHGRTPRNEALWGEPGTAYVYRCYGLHFLLNLVAHSAGAAHAVLLRSAEVVEGLDLVTARRGQAPGPMLLAGPGKLAQGLGVDLSCNTRTLLGEGPLVVRAALDAPCPLLVGPRVGVDYAEPRDRDAPLRFADARSAAVTHKRSLRTPGGNPRSR